MKQRGPCPISRCDLRDHATQERIDRIWERIEADLPMVESAAPALLVGLSVDLLYGGVCSQLVWTTAARSRCWIRPLSLHTRECLMSLARYVRLRVRWWARFCLQSSELFVSAAMVLNTVVRGRASCGWSPGKNVFWESLLSPGRTVRRETTVSSAVSQGDARLQSPRASVSCEGDSRTLDIRSACSFSSSPCIRASHGTTCCLA